MWRPLLLAACLSACAPKTGPTAEGLSGARFSPALSTGRFEGFRQLYVDPGLALKPVQVETPPGKADVAPEGADAPKEGAAPEKAEGAAPEKAEGAAPEKAEGTAPEKADGEADKGEAAPEKAEVPAAKPPPSHPETGDLEVSNIASARADVLVNGVKVGMVGPYTTAVIHDVPWGTYELGFTVPNGYTRPARVQTRAETLTVQEPLAY